MPPPGLRPRRGNARANVQDMSQEEMNRVIANAKAVYTEINDDLSADPKPY